MNESFQIPCVGYSIAADWYQGNNDQVLLTLVGYTSNKKNYEDLLSAVRAKTGSSVLVIDYSGHGESPFNLPDLTPAQNFLEVITAFDWIKDNYPNLEISVMGTSYGGFLAAQLTKYRKFNKLVLRVPAIYRPEYFYTKWKYINREENRMGYRKDKKALANHPLLKRAANFEGETLVVIHENDEMVPRETTDAFTKAFRANTYLAKGFKHSFGAQLENSSKVLEYQGAIADWLLK